MIKAKRDIINAILILVFCGAAYYETLSISSPVQRKTGASFFPQIIIIVIAVFGLCLLINSLIRIKKESNTQLNLSIPKLWRENYKVLLTFIFFGLYVLLMKVIGYLISSVLFMLAIYLLLTTKKRKIWAAVVSYIVITFAIYFVFRVFLYVFLPSGTFWG